MFKSVWRRVEAKTEEEEEKKMECCVSIASGRYRGRVWRALSLAVPAKDCGILPTLLPPPRLSTFSCFSDLNECPIKGKGRITLPLKGELEVGLQTGLFFHHA